EQLGGILLQSSIAQLHKSELQLHHRKHVLHLRAHRRLAPVLRPLHFVNTILVAVAPMGAVPSLRRALPDHFRLSAISLIAPHARFLAVQQIGQYHRIGYVGRRRHRRVDDLRLAIYSHVRLHPEVPLFALLRLVHLRSRAAAPGSWSKWGRAGWSRPRSCRSSFAPPALASAGSPAPGSAPPVGVLPASGGTCTRWSRPAPAHSPNQCPRTAASPPSRTEPLRPR